MRKKFSNSDASLLFGLLFVAIAFGTVWFSFRGWPLSPAPESLPLVKTEGLKWCEVYFYGPSDNDIRERYNGSDEERTLILLDARPPERSDTLDGNKDFNGGDLYCMADYFNLGYNLHEIKTLPEGSRTVFQYNFYYGDGTFFVVNVYPHALSVNGTLYQMEGDGEGDVTFVELLELLFWRLSAGDWP